MDTVVLDVSPESIDRAAGVIGSGGLVAFPTETVYGLGANALDASAVAKIFSAKDRPFFDPLIVHVADFSMAESVTDGFSHLARRLAERFWPGPLTLVLPKAACVPSIVTSGLSTVGVRMPAHPVARELIASAGVPVAAPSANLFGRLSPTRAQHVVQQLGGRIDVVLDGGRSHVGLESTVVRVLDDSVVLLRPGGLAAEEIEDFLGMRIVRKEELETVNDPDFSPGNQEGNKVGSKNSAYESPGELEWHYAPVVPLVLLEEGAFLKGAFPKEALADDAGVLGFCSVPEGVRGVSRVLSKKGDLAEAAVNLFDALHELEQAQVRRIFAEGLPERGLGRAVMDRLRKAAARFAKHA